jgi:hypothetical protein
LLASFSNLEFRSVTKDICKLPTFLSSSLFRKIDTGETGIVTRYASPLFIWLLFFWTSMEEIFVTYTRPVTLNFVMIPGMHLWTIG